MSESALRQTPGRPEEPVRSAAAPAADDGLTVERAFVLGAGLGTRLRPLTDLLPKPLIPVWHRPLAFHAFAHLHGAGVREFVVNTHHLPEKWSAVLPDGNWNGCPVTLRHEPVLLETGGGLANVADRLQGDSFLVYNGDILTDLPLAPAIRHHREAGNLITVVLRSDGPVRNVGMDPASGRVLDFRHLRGVTGCALFQFTGIYVARPEFFRYLVPGRIESVIGGFLRAIAADEPVGGVVIDEGVWLDLGDRRSYLAAHRLGAGRPWPGSGGRPVQPEPVHPEARVHPSAHIDAGSSVCPGAEVGADAVLEESVVWPRAIVAAGARLRRCVVRSGCIASGDLSDRDI